MTEPTEGEKFLRKGGEPEALAEKFHEAYERLAPDYAYQTREVSAVRWENVPPKNRALMIAVCTEILKEAHKDCLPVSEFNKRFEALTWDEKICVSAGMKISEQDKRITELEGENERLKKEVKQRWENYFHDEALKKGG
jgi:hypothetical protein